MDRARIMARPLDVMKTKQRIEAVMMPLFGETTVRW